MSSQYPPITSKQAVDIALAWGWQPVKGPRTKGDHKYFENTISDLPLQLDMGENTFGERYIRMMMKRMKLSREQFYCATKKTAKKIGKKPLTDEEIENLQ